MAVAAGLQPTSTGGGKLIEYMMKIGAEGEWWKPADESETRDERPLYLVDAVRLILYVRQHAVGEGRVGSVSFD